MSRAGYFLALLFFSSVFSAWAFVPVLPDTIASDSIKKNKILPGPVFNYSPETNFVFGLSGLYTFYSEKRDRITRPSFLFATAIYSLKKQFIGDIYLNTWSRRNRYHYVFEVSYYKYNYFYYGIGNNTLLSDQILLNQNKKELIFNMEKKLLGYYYLGWEFNYKEDRYSQSDANRIQNIHPVESATGGKYTRAGVSLIFDSRDTYTYARRGHYIKFNYSHTLPFLDREFDFHKFNFESRNFFTVNDVHTIGINTNVETVQGDFPFFEYRPLGGAFMMRGYYQGRFRDQNLAAGQVEYRWQFLRRIAAVAFAGTGMVFKNDVPEMGELKPNYGIGLRYFYDIASGVTIRLDYGIGEKIPGEKRVSNFYLFVNEAF